MGADWPIDYTDVKPYYEAIEEELPVSGEPWPWGDPHSYPYHAHPVAGNGEVFLRGAYALGVEARVGPVAIANGRFGNRPHCIYRGFCLQGCKVNAKASPLITHIPDALANGAEVRHGSMVTGVVVGEEGRATGVTYVRDGTERFQKARMVAIAGYSIETPRLLLLSTSQRFPDGVGNDFGQVGRYVMVQGAPQLPDVLPEKSACSRRLHPRCLEEFYETDPTRTTNEGSPFKTSRLCRSPTPNMWSPKDIGERRFVSTSATTCTGRRSERCASSFLATRTG